VAALGARIVVALGIASSAAAEERPAVGWPEWGGDAGGMRFSPLADVTRENVGRLEVSWTYRHGDWSDGTGEWRSTSAFELTPILFEGSLYGCTPMNRVFALDPETGVERWRHDPGLDPSGRYANQLICRGVASWADPTAAPDVACRSRIFTATNDGRLLALDAASGRPCAGFGEAGTVALKGGRLGPEEWLGEYQVTSAPTVVHDLVVVGSAVSDNKRTDAPSGVIRAFDVRTGALRWDWDLAPPGHPCPSDGSYVPGTPNVWAPFSADAARDLLFVPTGNPAPDYYRGGLGNIDYYGSSVVALRASTGELRWHFQTVHHDLWDYDVPAQPTLVDLRRDAGPVPAVIQATKMGHVFVLQRETGVSLFPVEERPVPQDGAPGEQLSPTQPFPVKPPPLVPTMLRPEDAWGFTPWDRGACRDQIASLRSDGIFTPPTVQGSVMYPGNAGGSNWGGVAVDPERQILVANVMNFAWTVRLIPRADFDRIKAANPGKEISPQTGTAFGMWRETLFSPFGVPCNSPPWGELVAIDLASGDVRWRVPLGTIRDVAPVPIPWKVGVPNVGGPLVTASGLVFIAAAVDDYLRAFDLESGAELWQARLPAGGQATPMTYRARPGGRQFLVIAAGGHARARTTLGDHLVAFALPE
jgi:quinoprotein glucose dehydrogenase